jgi:hypothetical protein
MMQLAAATLPHARHRHPHSNRNLLDTAELRINAPEPCVDHIIRHCGELRHPLEFVAMLYLDD